jgi:hypothetical protein
MQPGEVSPVHRHVARFFDRHSIALPYNKTIIREPDTGSANRNQMIAIPCADEIGHAALL